MCERASDRGEEGFLYCLKEKKGVREDIWLIRFFWAAFAMT